MSKVAIYPGGTGFFRRFIGISLGFLVGVLGHLGFGIYSRLFRYFRCFGQSGGLVSRQGIGGVACETVKVLFHHPHGIMYSIDKYNELHINMTSRRYKSVSNRQQISLLPPSIEDYVHETNPVRAIDAYVD